MSRMWCRMQTVLVAGCLLAGLVVQAWAAEVPRMATDELKARMGEAGLVILDARKGSDWNGSAEKIAGAVRIDPNDVEAWSGSYDKGQTIVLYCA